MAEGDFTVGDRVRVRWKDDQYDAAVIHVHAEGNVDVVYDVDGTVGAFLTAAEHGLNKLPAKEKPGVRICNIP